MRGQVLVATALLLTAAVAPVAAQGQSSASAYAGTHVTFDTDSKAVVDYTVNGETVADDVKVQSQSAAESGGSVSATTDLDAVTSTSFTGAALSVDATAEAQATVSSESGAQLRANDNSRGVLQVKSNGEAQYVHVDLENGASAESESDRRVVVTNEDGATGTFIVVGDGQVTVNERGNVTADLQSDAQLVYRQYPQGRSEEDEKHEQMIADGVVAAEVYVMEGAESGGDAVVDVVSYGQETTVTVEERTENEVRMTAESSQQQGKVVLTTISEQAFESVENLDVTVDGEAAAQAESYSGLRAAADDGETSKFLVRQQSSAEASADVLVAVNGFSTREVTMQSTDSDGSDGGTDGGSDGSDGGDDASGSSGAGPGFGAFAAVVALGAALVALRARQ